MFKKFLVLCAMLCCTALWGEEVYVAEDDVTKQEAVGEVKEYSSSDILKMMNLKDKLDYSYESHVDIPYDLYGDNKHVNRRLSKDEQAKYYANPLAYMENIAQNDWQRAFEMSMYYQGWKPNTIFFRFDFLMLNNDFNFIPSTDDMRFKARQVLDQAKALHWAQIAYDLAEKQIEADKNSNKKSYLKLNSHKADIIKMNLLFRINESDIDNKNEVLGSFFPEYNSLNSSTILERYKKNATLRVDTVETFKHFYAPMYFYAWRNFYCGFVYPKNKDFAISAVMAMDIDSSKLAAQKSLLLYKITSGLYDKEDIFTVKNNINIYKSRYITSAKNFISERLEKSKSLAWYNTNFIPEISLYSIENLVLGSFEFRDELLVKNPYFDKEKALKSLDFSLKNDTHDLFEGNPIISFVKYSAKEGISEEIYNEFLEIIRKKLGINFAKEEEEYAREFFNGRIPDSYEYR